MMIKQRFGKTQLMVSPVGFGSAPVAYLDTGTQRTSDILNRLLDAGCNLIDTAACYPGAEAMIGDTIAHRRDQYVIVSKCGHAVEQGDGEEWSAALIRTSIERSLQRLKTDHVDVMLLHSCDLPILERGEAWQALQDAQQAGLVRFIGYSGDNEAVAYAATLEGISVLQMSISIADQRNIDLVLPLAQQHDLAVLAKRPIADAAWKTTDEQVGLYKSYAAEYHKRLNKMQLDPATLGIAGPANVAWVELALRFTLSQPTAPGAIIGTTNPDHAAANLAIAEKGPLPDHAVQQIRQAFTNSDPDGKWLGEM